MRTFLFALLLLAAIHATSQQNPNVFAFFEYEIKDGMEDQFIAGYGKDLEWHKSQGDDWSWVGWFVVNGERRDRFIDATPNHRWADFDHWKVNSAENNRHNNIHWVPYVTNPSGGYKVISEAASQYKKDWYKSRWQQVYTVQLHSGREKEFQEFMVAYKTSLKELLKSNSFVWMKVASGGDGYQLFISLDNLESLALCENVFELSVLPKEWRDKFNLSVKSTSSELWSYSAALSLFAE
jgi:hypothetical protein